MYYNITGVPTTPNSNLTEGLSKNFEIVILIKQIFKCVFLAFRAINSQNIENRKKCKQASV